jgi:hypothetical protein
MPYRNLAASLAYRVRVAAADQKRKKANPRGARGFTEKGWQRDRIITSNSPMFKRATTAKRWSSKT